MYNTQCENRYGLGAISDTMKSGDDDGKEGSARVELMQNVDTSSSSSRADFHLRGVDGNCTVILARYSLRVEASVPLYIRQHIVDFPTLQVRHNQCC